MGQEDTLIADPYEELCDMSNKKTDDADLNDWLELQEQAKAHNRQMKELAAIATWKTNSDLSRQKLAMASGVQEQAEAHNRQMKELAAT
jgi:hypothetical protein